MNQAGSHWGWQGHGSQYQGCGRPPTYPTHYQISTIRLTVIPTKATRNTTMSKEKNSTATNNRNIISRKDKPKEKNSVKQKWRIKEQKQKRLWMPIGWMNLVSDMRSQRKKNSTSQIITLQKLLTCI